MPLLLPAPQVIESPIGITRRSVDAVAEAGPVAGVEAGAAAATAGVPITPRIAAVAAAATAKSLLMSVLTFSIGFLVCFLSVGIQGATAMTASLSVPVTETVKSLVEVS
ncbi:hypothetical protein GCM10017557_00650 [Streptomyces aurantiacus]|uniref:Uncharacterized protein n=1 Tax=Streptomyces aurantiacus TaxID=47760 RepID=A0A7G1NUG1_9ACTN|nr:hypothetical protein GCM10017557_00650 [Streptomyces aurantiacus]